MNNTPSEKLISAVFSSAVKTSVSQSSAKTAKPKAKAAAFIPPPAVAAHPKTSSPTQTSAASGPSAKPDPDHGWVAVAGKNKKKATATLLEKVKTQQQDATEGSQKTAHLVNNSFYVPADLQKHLHKPSEKKKKLSPAASEKKPPSKSFLAIMMAHDEPLKKAPKKKKSKKQPLKKQTKPAEPQQPKKVQPKEEVQPKEAPAETKACPAAEEQKPTDVEKKDNPGSKDVASSSSERREDNSLLLGLPYHVLTEGIMSFLRPEDIGSFARCNSTSKRIGEEGYLWQTMFRQRFPSSELSPGAMTEWKLAYQLTLSNIVDHLRCFHTKKTFFEDVLGVGVDFTINPKTKVVDYISLTQDLLSETAFRKNKVRKDVFGNKFKLFLPLYFSEDHFQRALPQIQHTIHKLCPHRDSYGFEQSMVLDVFPKIMTTFVVLLSDEGVSASRKSFNGLCRIHRLFMALAHEYPKIKREATMRLKLFAAQEKYRVKSACPSLGGILPLFMVVDQNVFGWHNIRSVYFQETLDRGALWVCKQDPSLENTRGPGGKPEPEPLAEKRVEATRQAMTVSLRLLMFQVYFIGAFCKGTTAQRASHYDRFFGQLDPELEQQGQTGNHEDTQPQNTCGTAAAEGPIAPGALSFASFRERINGILTVSTWQEFFRLIGMKCPATKTEMARLLSRSVENSSRKGYHKKGMDYARVQKSGTSKILSKGQEYSASSSLKQVTFTDVWGFHGDTKFLDATCLLYDKARNRVATVDYQTLQTEDNSVVHSGDVMRENGGTHTIELNLEAMKPEIETCVFVISAWAGAQLSDIVSPSVSFADADTGDSLCTYDLDAQDKIPHLTSVVMCKLYRSRKGGWHVQAIGDAHRGAADNYGPIYKAVEKLL